MNKNIEKTLENPIGTAITDALLKLKKEPQKDGIDLLDITKKLSAKKFGGKSKR